jgi:flagellar hook assembly protein FlgD
VLADNSEVLSPNAVVTVGAQALRLDQNHPNPFNPRTTISFTAPEPGHVKLAVYSPDGRLVRTLVDGSLPAGFKEVSWDGKDASGVPVSSGVYFYRLETGKQTLARKMVYLK